MRTGWRTALAIALSALTLALMSTGAVAAPAAQLADTVQIVDFQFLPAAMTVPAGTTVTWRHAGQAPHTVTSTTGVWDSGRLSPGQSFAFTFSSAGSFPYRCNIHPTMTGTITVEAPVAPAPAPAAPATPPGMQGQFRATPAPSPSAAPRAGTGVALATLPRGGWMLGGLALLLLLGAPLVIRHRTHHEVIADGAGGEHARGA